MCPNYEVVVFQPWTVTPPYLGTIAYCYTFKLGLPSHLFILPFSGLLFSFLRPTASPSVVVHRQIALTFHPLPTSYPDANLRPPGSRPYPPPATRQPPLLVPSPRAACLCLPLFPVMLCSPIYPPRPAPGSLSYPDRFACRGSLCASVSLPCPPCVPLQIMASSGPWSCCWVDFRVRARFQGTSTPWKSRALVLSPPSTWTFRLRSDYPHPPPSFLPLPPPLVFIIPPLLV